MSEKLKLLQEQRDALGKKINELAAKHKTPEGWSAEDRAAFDAANADYDAKMKEVESVLQAKAEEDGIQARLARIAEDEQRLVRSGSRVPGREDRREADRKFESDTQARAKAFTAFLRGSCRNESELDACAKLGFDPRVQELHLNGPDDSTQRYLRSLYTQMRNTEDVFHHFNEKRAAMSVHDIDTGGSLVAPIFVNRIETMMLAYGDLLSVADTMVTDTGAELHWPTFNDTANVGTLIGESESIGSGVNPATGLLKWGAYDISSTEVIIPERVLEDASPMLEMMLPNELAGRIGRKMNQLCTTGTGAGATFRGIVTAATLGKTTASATAITIQELIALQHSVPVAYRANNALMMHDGILSYLRQLVDSEGRPLWVNGVAPGMPDTFMPGTNGVPMKLYINQDMDSTVTTTKKTILCGDFSRYKIRRVRGLTFRRLNELHAATRQVGFIAFIRGDGNLLENSGAGTIRYMLQA